MTKYCANCDSEATHAVRHTSARMTPLCRTCKEAYSWGQAHPEARLCDIEHVAKWNYIQKIFYEPPGGWVWITRADGSQARYCVHGRRQLGRRLAALVSARAHGRVRVTPLGWEWSC